MSARSSTPPALASCPPDLEDALARGGAVDAATVRGFIEAQRRAGLLQGDRPLCPLLSPLVLSSRTYHRMASAAALVLRALERVAARALSDAALADLLGIPSRERALHAVDPGYPSAVVIGRLDMVFTGSVADDEPSFSFIELNAESPAGIADQRLLEATQLRLPVVREHVAALRVMPVDATRALLDALLESHRR